MNLKARKRSRAILLAAGIALSAGIFASPAPAGTVTAVMQGPLRSLDPIITTAYIVRNYGYMVYDTLLALDGSGQIQPQMLQGWKVSDDGTTYTFTLRDGLKWSDGTPVRAEDCVASIKRWATVDKTGQMMSSLLQDMSVVDDHTFTMHFKVPTSIALSALSKPSGSPAFMMPETVAATPADVAITATIGSGPFKFVESAYQPGVKAVFVKNEHYVPRAEPPSGLAGGKVVKVDEVRWISMPDNMTAVSAMRNGEVDFMERAPYDLLPLLESDKNISLAAADKQATEAIARMNFLYPPFDNQAIRKAAMMAISQKQVMQAVIGNQGYYKECFTIYGCGNTLASDAGADSYGRGNIEAAKSLLKEAHYDGTPVIILHPTDNPMSAAPPVIAQLLTQAGFKVDLQSMDWQTLLNRRASKNPPKERGWNLFATGIGIGDAGDPLGNFTLPANGAKAWVGWPDVPAIGELRRKFAQAQDTSEQKKVADEIQQVVLDQGVILPLGQYTPAMAVRSSLTGVLRTYVPVFWSVVKAGN